MSVGRTARLAGSVIAGLTVFCYEPVVIWSPLMRVDMLAVALDFLAVLCAVTSAGRPWRLYTGFALFLLAMFTKQTSIAGPLATLPVMLLIGFGTRFAALGLLAVTALIQLYAAPEMLRTVHIYWAAILAVLLSLGPGQISFDDIIRLIARR